jgi:SAM-dependent methyltransferase
MSQRDLETAADFCNLVQSANLLEYLGLPSDSTLDQRTTALTAKRRLLQGMQSNPKYRDSARMYLKNYRALERVMAEPGEHIDYMRHQREAEKLPMLEMAIDSILVDGKITPDEEAFVREAAVKLEISLDTYERVLEKRAAERGVPIPSRAGFHPQMAANSDVYDVTPISIEMPTIGTTELTLPRQQPEIKGADGHAWWDATFTRLLLETIPGGPGELVDMYCRSALSAKTLLPQRPQLSYLGIDRNTARLASARADLEHWEARVHLAEGQPHSLPILDQSVDFALAIRALATLTDTAPVFGEAMRVLRPGGRMIAAEPDGLAETFYFDGHLADYNAAFHRLCQVVDRALSNGQPDRARPGIAVGPRLGLMMEMAGMQVGWTAVHASHNAKPRPWSRFSRRLRDYPAALVRAARLDESLPALLEVQAAVEALNARHRPERVGVCGHMLPMFLSVGIKQ